MNTITIIMAREPEHAERYADQVLNMAGHIEKRWPEIAASGTPCSVEKLLAKVDRWISKLPSMGVVVITASGILCDRLRRRVAEGALLAEAVRFVWIDGEKVREFGVNRYGACLDWPTGWCDADATESAAILRASMERRRAEARG